MAVIVNIPNAHDDNSQWNESGGYWDINVRTNDGYVFVGDIKAVYNNKNGYPKSVVLQQNRRQRFGHLVSCPTPLQNENNYHGEHPKRKRFGSYKRNSGHDRTTHV